MERYTSAPSGWLRWRTPRVVEQALATASTPRIAVSFRIPVFMLVSYRVALSHRLAVHLRPVCSLPYRAAGDLLRLRWHLRVHRTPKIARSRVEVYIQPWSPTFGQ